MASQIAPSVGIERSLSGKQAAFNTLFSLSEASPDVSLQPAEVSSLRAAATAAVAECTGGLGIVGASALSKQPKPSAGSDDTHSVSQSGRSQTGLQSGQSLGSVTRNTQKLSIQGEQSTADEPTHDLSGHHQTAGYALDALQACPPHGAKAICGRRPKMEDAYTAIPFLLEVPVPADQFCVSELIPPRIATHVKASEHDASEPHTGPEAAAAAAPQSSSPSASMHHAQYMETLHFFGVFDGHGGAEAALHCAQTLHQRIAEALSAVSSPAAQDKIRESFAKSQNETAAKLGTTPAIHQSVQQHLSGSFSDAKLQPLADPKPLIEGKLEEADSDDDSAVNEVLQEERRASQDLPESKGAKSVPQTDKPTQAQQDDSDAPCSADAFQSALTNAFTKADEEFGKADNAALVGTTAVVALVGSRQLYVANCGRSPHLTLAAVCAIGHALHDSASQQAKLSWYCCFWALAVSNLLHFEHCSMHKFAHVCVLLFAADLAPCAKQHSPLLTKSHLCLGNAGDSRAVLSRGDVAIPLTDDHKAAREDETVNLLCLSAFVWL